MATPTHTVEVVAVVPLSPRMTRVTVSGPSLRGMDATGAPEIALALIDGTGRPVRRRYTARALSGDPPQLDIDVVRHGHGPGSAWGDEARPGDALTFTGPRGRIVLGPAAHHLLIADEAGLPAVAALLEQAPATASIAALLEVHDGAEQAALAAHLPAGGAIQWALRDGRPAGQPEPIVAALAQLAGLDERLANTETWIFAESRAGVAIRDALAARGAARASVHVKGYWNTGRERPTGPAVQAVESGQPIVAVVPITPT